MDVRQNSSTESKHAGLSSRVGGPPGSRAAVIAEGVKHLRFLIPVSETVPLLRAKSAVFMLGARSCTYLLRRVTYSSKQRMTQKRRAFRQRQNVLRRKQRMFQAEIRDPRSGRSGAKVGGGPRGPGGGRRAGGGAVRGGEPGSECRRAVIRLNSSRKTELKYGQHVNQEGAKWG